jgi:hypothetical protein
VLDLPLLMVQMEVVWKLRTRMGSGSRERAGRTPSSLLPCPNPSEIPNSLLY